MNWRGFISSEAVASNNYFIDKWKSDEDQPIYPELNSNGINPNGAIYQTLYRLSAYIGKKMTFTIGLSSGNVFIISGMLSDMTINGDMFITTDGLNEISVGGTSDNWYVWINHPSSTIQWAALYEGEYNAYSY